MLFGNTIEFAHVALGLVPEILYAVDVVVAVREQLGMVDPKVVKVRDIKHIIAPPAVRMVLPSCCLQFVNNLSVRAHTCISAV